MPALGETQPNAPSGVDGGVGATPSFVEIGKWYIATASVIHQIVARRRRGRACLLLNSCLA